MRRNELLTIYGKDYRAMTRKLLEEAGLSDMIPSGQTDIFIKPNLVAPVTAQEGATTHPEVVEALIVYLRDHGFEKLTVMESSWVGDRTADSLSICGYDEMLGRLHVPFVDLQKDKGVGLDCAGMRLNVCSKALEPHFLINVPVLKGHCQTKMTCALKNMKGMIPGSEKRRFHSMGLHKPIGHLSAGLHQDFILVDSICGDLSFEDGGHPVQRDCLIAAADPVLCDTYACKVVGVDPAAVEYIGIAAGLDVGSMDLDGAYIRSWREVMCESNATDCGPIRWESVDDEQMLAGTRSGDYHGRVMELAKLTMESDSCSACYGSLIPALDRLGREGLLGGLHDMVCIGQGQRSQSGQLGVGNCTRHFKHSLAGCPPTQEEMYRFLKAYIEDRGE